MPPEVVIDATNLVLGRMASIVAKMLLMGYKVTIVNAEKAVVSGKPKMVIESYKLLFGVKTLRNPYRTGIRRPRTPERIIRYAIRGMLPKNNPRGKKALKNLRVYVGVPEEVKGKEIKTIKEASADRLRGKYITVGELAKQLGWKGVMPQQ
ncbi:MAG TPA: 50S ribosomal protein L13 [Desulfurococcaceae archaeon]|nr:50S ribosomal protein L13 [Desulfurococcaceae archaeon]